MSSHTERLLLSGNEAVARAALDAGVALGVGYPGTPSSEILEALADIGGRAQWSPNEKVAYEVALGVAFARTRALVTMKHVGLNVAADPLFTSAYTGVDGALVVVSADDPGMASSQNEQDNRRYAVAAGLPILEPADSQEAYDYFLKAVEISERWNLPVILRMTTRICHSKTVVRTRQVEPPPEPAFQRDVKSHVMIPAYARPAHRRLREKLSRIAAWNEQSDLNTVHEPLDGNGDGLGIVTSGVSFVHAREAAPQAKILKLGMAHPFPAVAARRFAAGVERLLVVEEGDPYLVEQLRVAGIEAEGKPEMYRFGELNVGRVRRIVARDDSPEPTPPRGKPPALCQGCPHRMVFETLSRLDCIVTGDIGCYTLGVLPPFEAIDTCVCMGAAVGVGLGLRHVLPDEPGKRVVSVIGDSTFVHSGITGLVEMLYNPPANGHLLLILDNGTTAMTGLQEHPGTGRTLDHRPTNRLVFEDLATALGVDRVKVFDPAEGQEAFEAVVREALDAEELSVIIVRRPCVLAAGKIKQYEKAIAAGGGNHE
jgi:indolepyruvate ferredoxin oxidoreductase alpha subunit